jgi:uncharacterized protein DUF1565
MISAPRIAFVLLVAACGNVKNDDQAGDAAPPADDSPNTTVKVAPTGDDAADGIAAPVKTLKRGIGIAGTNPMITTISLAAGRYEAATGETFPYTVPPNLTVHGPSGGGAILAGTATIPGLVVDAGTLRDLELETFMVAITSRAATTLANVRVRESVTALRAEAAAQLTVDGLDVTGTAGACATAIELNGGADLKATNVATRTLGVALDARDQSTVDLAANITGDGTCNTAAILSNTNKTLALHDTIIDGGHDGISFGSQAGSTQATFTNTTIRNVTNDGLINGHVVLNMTGGALTDNGRAGMEAAGGKWTFTNVAIKNHPVMGIYIQLSSTELGVVTLRGCTLTGNRDGIYFFDGGRGDLGTAASPGNNVIQGNSGVGLNIDGGPSSPANITAIGNTWRPNVQGANAQGKYTDGVTVNGPVEPGAGGNFAVNMGWSISR